jgi:hypothetical protein
VNCDCITKINEQLKAQGLALVVSFRMPTFTPVVAVQTRRLVGKGKATPVLPSYCPFCGQPATAEKGQE